MPYTFTDKEASAVRAWSQRQPPKPPFRTGGGMARAAELLGISRKHLAYAVSPDPEKRRPISADLLATFARLIAEDRAAYNMLRRVGSDEVQGALDRALKAAEFVAKYRGGFLVAVLPC